MNTSTGRWQKEWIVNRAYIMMQQTCVLFWLWEKAANVLHYGGENLKDRVLWK